MAPPISTSARLRADLDRLADEIDQVGFGLGVPGQSTRRERVQRASTLTRRYLIPRLGEPDAPLLVAVFGPTGAGKSTVVSSLAGRTISEPGALRPTTRRPVIWCHEVHASRYAGLQVDATLETDDVPLLGGLTLVDTPDLDSYVAEHADMARAILDVADAALYVTTPQRYADAVPWVVVNELVERTMPLVVIANRLSRRSSGAVADLASLLREHGLESARADQIVQIQEHRLRSEGRLPRSAVERVRERLVGLAMSSDQVIAATAGGTIAAVVDDARAIASDIDAQRREADAFWEAASIGYRHQYAEIEAHLQSGELVRGEVVARWQRMIGVTDLASLIARGWGRVRDIVTGGGPVEPERVAQVGDEARRELADLAHVRTQRAVTAAVTAWEIEPGAKALITGELRRVGGDLSENVAFEIDEWMAGLVTLIEAQGRERFRLARLASVGINAAATMLLLGVFASTGGITGAEVGVAAGTAAAQQTVLEHLFGSAAATALARRARQDLADRLGRVLEIDSSRFRAALDSTIDDPGLADSIGDAVARVEGSVEDLARG